MFFSSAANLLDSKSNSNQESKISSIHFDPQQQQQKQEFSETFRFQVKLPKNVDVETEMIHEILEEFQSKRFSNFLALDPQGLKYHSSFPEDFEFPSNTKSKNALCFVSLSPIFCQNQNSIESYFGILVHDVKILKKYQRKENNSNWIVFCSISFTPFLFRSPPMKKLNSISNNNNEVVRTLVNFLRENSQKFVALNQEAAELGIGDLTLFSSIANKNKNLNSDSFSSLSGILLPFLDQVRILACGIDFPFVDEENKTILSFENNQKSHFQTLTSRNELAENHLKNLRNWLKKKNNNDNNQEEIPLWLLPTDPNHVEFWCAICYVTTFHKKEQQPEDDDNKFHFLVPSSMILFSSVVCSAGIVDVRVGDKIPPQLRDEIQQECFYEFLESALFSSSSSLNFQIIENSVQFEQDEKQEQESKKIEQQEEKIAPKRRARVKI